MDSKTVKHIPLIDLSNLSQRTPTWESAKSQVRVALEEYGCFEAVFDQIPLHLRESLFDGTQQLFDVPLEIKQLNKYDFPARGYIGQHPVFSIYESLGIKDVFSPGNIESFTHLMWPNEDNPNFSKSVQFFAEQMFILETSVRRMIVESLGLEKYTDEHIGSTNYTFRLNKFVVPKSHESNLGIPFHTDRNFVTILYSNGVKGLEVLTRDGEWIAADPSPNSFIVLIGDCLHAWTNGHVNVCRHKVVMKGYEPRYAIGLFTSPKDGDIIKAPEEMVDEEHPLLFKPFNFAKFIAFSFSEEGRKFQDPLKAYCGA